MKENSQSEGNVKTNELKTDDLEKALEKLQQMNQGESEDTELFKLKRLVLTFKKKYKQALKELSNKEHAQSGENAETIKKLQEVQEENAALIEQQKFLKELVGKSKEQLDEALKKIRDLEERPLMQEESDELERQVAELKHYKDDYSQLQRRIDKYNQENDDLQYEVSRLNNLLTAEKDRTAETTKEIQELHLKLVHAEEAALNLDQQNRQYESQLAGGASEGDSFQGNSPDLSEKLTALEKEKLQHLQKEKELKEKIWLLREELSHTNDELAHARVKLESSQVSLDELSTENVEYKAVHEQLENISENAHDEVEDLRQQLFQVKEGKRTLESQHGELKEVLHSTQQELNQIKAELQHAQNQLQEAETFVEKIDSGDSSGVDASEMKRLREENQTQHHRIEKLIQVIQEREKRVSELQRYEFSFKKVSEINQKYDKEINSKKQIIDQLKEEKKSLDKVLEDTQGHSSQLERAVEHLRSKSEEVQLNALTLEQDFQEVLELKETLQEEVAKHKENEEELQRSLNLSQEKNLDLEHELHLLTSQLTQAKSDILRQDELSKNNVETLGETEKQLAQAIEEKSRLEQEILEKEKYQSSLEKELETMKQTLVKGLKEAKDIKHYYHNLANEKSAVIQKTTQMHEHIKALTEQIKRKDNELQEFQQRINNSKTEMLEYENKLQREVEKHRDYEQQIKERDESLSSFAEQIKTIQSKLRTVEQASEEKDGSVVEAQQQFAKKVREVAQLSEAKDELKRQVAKLQDDLIEAKARANESHSNYESNLEQMKKLQEQVTAAEKKYFMLHEKLQEVEVQNRELKKVEEKHQQMQQLLSNLGNVIGSPVGITQPYDIVADETKPPVKPVDIPQAKLKPKKPEKTIEREVLPQSRPEDQSLFEQKDSSSKFKKDLFDQ